MGGHQGNAEDRQRQHTGTLKEVTHAEKRDGHQKRQPMGTKASRFLFLKLGDPVHSLMQGKETVQ